MSCNANGCLICFGELIDNSFNTQDAHDLCRILGLEECNGDPPNSNMNTFSVLFESATYCPQCVRLVKDLGQILRNIDELYNKLDPGRKIVETQLRKSHSLDVGQCNQMEIDEEEELDLNYNQNLRKRILTRLDQKEDRLISKTVKTRVKARRFKKQFVRRSKRQEQLRKTQHTNTKIKSISSLIPTASKSYREENRMVKQGFELEYRDNIPLENNTLNKENTNFQVEQIMPPSPTHSFVSSASFEEKFILPGSPTPETKDSKDESEQFHLSYQNTQPESQPLAVVKVSSNFKGVSNGNSLQCPHYPECRQTFDNRIRLDAHVKRFHEEIQRCYTCTTCGKGFITDEDLQEHILVHNEDGNSNINPSTKSILPQDLSECVLKSGLPIVLLGNHLYRHIHALEHDKNSNIDLSTKNNQIHDSNDCVSKSGLPVVLLGGQGHVEKHFQVLKPNKILNTTNLSTTSSIQNPNLSECVLKSGLPVVLLGNQLQRHNPVVQQLDTTSNSNNLSIKNKQHKSQNLHDCVSKSGLPVVLLNKLKDTEISSYTSDRVLRNIKTKYYTVRSRYSTCIKSKDPPIIKKRKYFDDKNNEDIIIQRISCPRKTCNKTFKITEECQLQAHIKRVHEGIKNCYICSICNKSFGTYKQIKIHEYEHTGISPYICEYCHEICKSQDKLNLHIGIEHKPELLKYKCQYCDKGFVKKHYYKLHLLRHTKKLEFLCEICSKRFKTATYLRYHQSKHHYTESSYDPFKCIECGKIFAAPANLRGHIMKQHRGEFKHQCKLCEYGALTPSGLNIHMINKHSNERNFKCDLCPVTFKHNARLTIHKRTHTGERPYKCKICEKGFTNISGLKRHELIHSSIQCHVCEICGKKFPLKNYLYVHMRSHKNKQKKIDNKKNLVSSTTTTTTTIPNTSTQLIQMQIGLPTGTSTTIDSDSMTSAETPTNNTTDFQEFLKGQDYVVLPENALLTGSNFVFQHL